MQRKKKLIVTGMLVGGISLAFVALSDVIPPRQFGPIKCDSCQVAPYMPDASTLAFLTTYEREMSSVNRLFTGDSITVCNASFCTTYTITESGDYLGSGAKDNTPPKGGGGGGGGGGVGTFTPPSTGGSGGTVTVGQPSLPPCRPAGIGPKEPEGSCI